MVNALLSIAWSLVFANSASAETHWQLFEAVVREHINIYVPLRQNSVRSKMWPPNVYKLHQHKKHLNRQHQMSGDNNVKAQLDDTKRLFNRALREFENKREHSVLHSGSQSRFWAYVRQKQRCASRIPPLELADGSTVVDDMGKANALSAQYESVFTADDGVQLQMTNRHFTTTIETVTINVGTVFQQLHQLQPKVSCGPDNIPSIVLQRAAVALAEPLTTIYTLSFHSGVVPSAWRCANITPIPKHTHANKPVDLRPLSMTAAACRAFERLLVAALIDHLRTQCLYSKCQYGFRSGRSTVLQLIDCLNRWTRALDDGECVDVILADISKAFDTVTKSKLLHKLWCYGVRGKMYNWFAAFLSDRKQRVVVGNAASDWVPVGSGVPQGSCVGPILFLLYVNDLPDYIQSSEIRLFADDAKLFFSANSADDIARGSADINRMLDWCERNQLAPAVHKFKALHIGNSNVHHQYAFNNTAIPSHESVRDLGVVVHESLKPSQHCAEVARKASTACAALFRTFTTRDHEFMLRLYCAFVRSSLEYATAVWSPTLQKDIQLIEKVQHVFTKRLLNDPFMSYTERLQQLQLETLEKRRLLCDLELMWKIINSRADIDKNDLFALQQTVTRSHNKQIVYGANNPRPKKTVRHAFFTNRVMSCWNALSVHTVNATTAATFRNRLNKENLRNHLTIY